MYHFDVKKFGVPQTRPELRITPLRDAPYHRLVRTVIEARDASKSAESAVAASLQAGEVALLMDGGRPGNAARLLAPWRE
eukprot:11392510-Karenia_brevis.AAC.1